MRAVQEGKGVRGKQKRVCGNSLGLACYGLMELLPMLEMTIVMSSVTILDAYVTMYFVWLCLCMSLLPSPALCIVFGSYAAVL